MKMYRLRFKATNGHDVRRHFGLSPRRVRWTMRDWWPLIGLFVVVFFIVVSFLNR